MAASPVGPLGSAFASRPAEARAELKRVKGASAMELSSWPSTGLVTYG